MAKLQGDVSVSFHIDELPQIETLKAIKWILEVSKGEYHKAMQQYQDELVYPGNFVDDEEAQSYYESQQDAIAVIAEFETFLDLLTEMTKAVERHT